jgi:hypothetical protein
MRCSADTPTRNEFGTTGWMAFCAAVRDLKKQEATSPDRAHLPMQDGPDASVH